MDISIHYLDSVLLIENSSYLMKSDAIIRISQQLQGRWSYLSHLSIIPKPIRDAVYDLVAKNRLKWFGQRAACTLPVYEVKDRFPE
jgi:predicted DCC family thiol-disulfide oxidoreductase YuxK